MLQFLFTVLVATADLIHAQSGSTYKAAVVEFSVDQTNENRVENNLEGFKDALEQITSLGGAHIVVFPEDAILGILYKSRKSIFPYLERIPEVPNSKDPVIPCNDQKLKKSNILCSLSCLAQKFKTVLVANMGEKQPCNKNTDSKCDDDGHYQYNTNVVFETDGELIAKYRKQNLYNGEKDYFDPGAPGPSNCVSFPTSFGVTFGTFTCYDILYDEPGDCLLKNGVRNFVYPTAWGNSFPFYVSAGVQQSWSLKHSVNFLAANQLIINAKNKKGFYSSGSGIYSSGNAKYFISGKPSAAARKVHVIIAELPMIPPTNFQPSGTVLDVDKISMRTSRYVYKKYFIHLEESSGIIHVSTDPTLESSLTCTLDYNIKSLGKNEYYALGAYIGVRDFGYAVCCLVRCQDKNSCGSPVKGYTADTVFEKLELSGTFPTTSTVYATAFQSGLKLLSSSGISVGDNNLVISDNTQPLLSASLWAQVKIPEAKNSAEPKNSKVEL